MQKEGVEYAQRVSMGDDEDMLAFIRKNAFIEVLQTVPDITSGLRKALLEYAELLKPVRSCRTTGMKTFPIYICNGFHGRMKAVRRNIIENRK